VTLSLHSQFAIDHPTWDASITWVLAIFVSRKRTMPWC
jgi:hypothetical protein